MTPTAQHVAQGFSLGGTYQASVAVLVFHPPVPDSDEVDINPRDVDARHAHGMYDPVLCRHDDARSRRPMNELTCHSGPQTRTASASHPMTLLDVPSRTSTDQRSQTTAHDNRGPRPPTSLAHALVIVEADRLRRGVNSPFPGSSTATDTRQGTKNAADGIKVRGKTTSPQNRLRVTQATEHKVARDWVDTRHPRDYTPIGEIPVDPTRRRTYQIMLMEHGFETRAVSSGGTASSARQHESRRGNDNDHLDQPRRQEVQTSLTHILENAMKTFKPYDETSAIREKRYLEKVSTDLNSTFGFNALESYGVKS
ncbi:hypothetical protein EDB89DRAFT_2188490 [Lactarius sanguifluus]|nr:hypothetical protein EDB89DRAFT_2188490 [Lactarius sanguifluus]